MRSSMVRLASVLLLAAAGCSHGGNPPPPGLKERHYDNLRELASAELSCPVEQLSARGTRGSIYTVEGCGRQSYYYLRVVPAAARFWMPVPDLRARAAFDLGCEPSALQITELSATARGVRGCDKSATYNLKCHSACGWAPEHQAAAP